MDWLFSLLNSHHSFLESWRKATETFSFLIFLLYCHTKEDVKKKETGVIAVHLCPNFIGSMSRVVDWKEFISLLELQCFRVYAHTHRTEVTSSNNCVST